ncbi:lmo0954 family membrane protein [Pseudogracilibacillus sp. SO30301A]|uniref:lmo0954 family membrane protein n=1 Tax=Pseudogracilibacillus sp. SO30301A TaxID=3098291 RepID=UPI00300DC04A
MKKILLFIGGLIAALILVANLGPLVLLGLSIWLLYVIVKQIFKSESTTAKVIWVIIGLAVLSIGISNIYAILGIAAAYVLYLIVKNWNKEKADDNTMQEDPFVNFEEQWGEFNKY